MLNRYPWDRELGDFFTRVARGEVMKGTMVVGMIGLFIVLGSSWWWHSTEKEVGKSLGSLSAVVDKSVCDR